MAAVIPEVIDPHTGDLWRLEWDGEAVLAVVAATAGDTVDMLAVDLEPDTENSEPYAVYVSADATVMRSALAIWPRAAVRLPRVALDRRLGTVPAMPAIASDPRVPETWGLYGALRRLRAFAGRVDDALNDSGGEGSIADLLREHSITRSDLVAAGLSPRVASLILQGRRQPDPEHVLAIARTLEFDPRALQTAVGSVPGGLMAELHLPRRRAQIQERAIQEGRPDTQVRREAARRIAAPANRSQRGAAAPDWSAAVDAYFAQ
jgi:hypothetical protein